jgi:hypothetical protein
MHMKCTLTSLQVKCVTSRHCVPVPLPSRRAVKEVAEGEDPDAFWTRVGSAWPHKDGKGLNLVLSALPINGRLVLREYTPEDEKKDVEKVAKFRKK